MLKFWQKIRRKLIEEGNLKRYFFYAIGEILLVMIGILLALQVNNWHQNNINSEIRKNFLLRLQGDFNQDLKDLKIQQDAHQIRTSNAQKFMKYFNQTTIVPDTFNNLFWSLFYSDNFIENDNTFSDLINTGRLDLIALDELKFGLLDLYSNYENLNAFEEHINRDNIDYIYNPTFSIADANKFFTGNKEEFSANFLNIASSIKIKNGFNLYLSNSPVLDNFYSTSLAELEQLDSLINNELTKY